MSFFDSKFWRELREELALTPQEKRVAIFLVFSALIGVIIRWLQFRLPEPNIIPAVVVDSSAGKDTARASHRKPATHFPIDVNAADTTQLIAVPGIGPVLAKRIVEFRDRHGKFRSLNDLLKVKGIGAKKLEKIRPYIKIGHGVDNPRRHQQRKKQAD